MLKSRVDSDPVSSEACSGSGSLVPEPGDRRFALGT